MGEAVRKGAFNYYDWLYSTVGYFAVFIIIGQILMIIFFIAYFRFLFSDKWFNLKFWLFKKKYKKYIKKHESSDSINFKP